MFDQIEVVYKDGTTREFKDAWDIRFDVLGSGGFTFWQRNGVKFVRLAKVSHVNVNGEIRWTSEF